MIGIGAPHNPAAEFDPVAVREIGLVVIVDKQREAGFAIEVLLVDAQFLERKDEDIGGDIVSAAAPAFDGLTRGFLIDTGSDETDINQNLIVLVIISDSEINESRITGFGSALEFR